MEERLDGSVAREAFVWEGRLLDVCVLSTVRRSDGRYWHG